MKTFFFCCAARILFCNASIRKPLCVCTHPVAHNNIKFYFLWECLNLKHFHFVSSKYNFQHINIYICIQAIILFAIENMHLFYRVFSPRAHWTHPLLRQPSSSNEQWTDVFTFFISFLFGLFEMRIKRYALFSISFIPISSHNWTVYLSRAFSLCRRTVLVPPSFRLQIKKMAYFIW